jgi:hypothetical protein
MLQRKLKLTFYVQYLFFQTRSFYEIMWKKYGKARQATDDNIIGGMRIVCWINRATDTHSEYEVPISFPQQRWLRERASMSFLYVHCLSCSESGLISFGCTPFSSFSAVLHTGKFIQSDRGCFIQFQTLHYLLSISSYLISFQVVL